MMHKRRGAPHLRKSLELKLVEAYFTHPHARPRDVAFLYDLPESMVAEAWRARGLPLPGMRKPVTWDREPPTRASEGATAAASARPRGV